MRHFLILLWMFISATGIFAGENGKFSPALEAEIEKAKRTLSLSGLPKSSSITPNLSVLIYKKSGVSLFWDASSGIQIGSESERFATAYLDLEALSALENCSDVLYVDLAPQARPALDVSIREMRADLVHQGALPLSQAFRGKGVVIGIIDTGIDIDHRDFFDGQGNTRISFLWDQTADGNAPSGFLYGTEWSAADIQAGTCTETDGAGGMGHGTHVAGIAAANGLASGNFVGVAPEAELVVVKTDFNFSHILDGISYIFQRAGSKPVAVNLSLSTHQGAHDGTSFPARMVSDLLAPGRIVVAAASNEGNDPIHLRLIVDEGQLFGSKFSVAEPADEIKMDIWYDPPGNIDFAVAVYDTLGSLLAQSSWIKPGQKMSSAPLRGDDKIYSLVTLNATETRNPFNGARHVYLRIDSDNQKYDISRRSVVWALLAKGSGELDAWLYDGESIFEAFSGKAGDIQFVSGDSYSTVGIPATAAEVICVGAYSSKNSWTSIDGSTYSVSATLGALAAFSSVGPTRDGRIKPDLVAPGFVIASAMSGDADILNLAKPRVLQDQEHWVLQGTSMAAPHVTGAVALLLEQDPELTASAALEWLTSTARQDEFTGSVPNNLYGSGKIDLFAAMTASATAVVASATSPDDFRLEQNHPNPFSPGKAAGAGQTVIPFSLPAGSRGRLTIFNILGQAVFETELTGTGITAFSWNGRNRNGDVVSPGVYYYRLQMLSSGRTATKKLLILR